MKKFYMILAAVAAMTLTAQAQNYAEINVGNYGEASTYNGSYNEMAPTNFYVAHTGVQMLFTPDLLADMNGKENVAIKSLDFWFYCETFEEIVRDVKIYLQEVNATEFAVNDDGVKQFFNFGNPVKEMEINYDMISYYGEDVCLSFDFEPFAFTPGKSLLVTMVFDAQDDDNCTMGSDYAPFYTSGIRNRAMTYTNNWNSFIDFAWGLDFPNATATLGCGTNVELPVTRIGYNYDEASQEGITTLSQANALEDAAEFTFNGNAVVTAFKNGYLFLRDESGYGMIAGVQGTFANGQVLALGWNATKTSNDGWAWYTDAAGLNASGETNAELAAAQKLTGAVDESMLNAYVYVENVTISGGLMPGLPMRSLPLPDGSSIGVTSTLWSMSWPASGSKNIYGVICKVDGALKINVIDFDDYVEPEPQGLLGDVNDDGVVNITDVTLLINAVLNDDMSNINVVNADMNSDGNVNITDVTMLISAVLDSAE